MSAGMIKYASVCGVLASLFCLTGGLWILAKVGFDLGGDAVSTGLGLYFIGKAFFVGPLLIVTAQGQRNS